MSFWSEGDVTRIAKGTTGDSGDMDMDDYHYLVKGTLVRIEYVVSDEETIPGWGGQYRARPVDDVPEAWVGGQQLGSQIVYDCHLEAPVVPTTIPEIERFLEDR